MDSAWDQLLDLIDRLPTHPDLAADLERTVAALTAEAMSDGAIDRELHVADVSRWIVGLIAAHRIVRETHPDVDPDSDLAALRVIVTRWLHPARPR